MKEYLQINKRKNNPIENLAKYERTWKNWTLTVIDYNEWDMIYCSLNWPK